MQVDQRAGSLGDAHEARSVARLEHEALSARERDELGGLSELGGEALEDRHGKLPEPERAQRANAQPEQAAARLEVVARPREQPLLAERQQDPQRRGARNAEPARDFRRGERRIGVDEQLEHLAGTGEARDSVLIHLLFRRLPSATAGAAS